MPELGQHGEDHIWQVEGDVRNQQPCVAVPKTHKQEQQHQRNTRHEVRVDHRQLGDVLQQQPVAPLHGVQADGRERTEHGCDNRRDRGDGERYHQRIRDLRRAEQLHIPVKCESRPVAARLALVKRVYDQNQDRRVEEHKHQAQIRAGKELLQAVYHSLPPPSSLVVRSAFFMNVIEISTKANRMIDSALPVLQDCSVMNFM